MINYCIIHYWIIFQVCQLQASHAKLLVSRNQLDSTHRLQLHQLQEVELRANQELNEARKAISNLESDLAAAKEVINATNEAIVIKVRNLSHSCSVIFS